MEENKLGLIPNQIKLSNAPGAGGWTRQPARKGFCVYLYLGTALLLLGLAPSAVRLQPLLVVVVLSSSSSDSNSSSDHSGS